MQNPGTPSNQIRARASVRVGFPLLLAPLLRKTVLAITIGRWIWIHPRVLEHAPKTLAALLRHEMVHVAQYERDGTARFLFRYVWEYLRGRWSGMGHWEAYRAISYEREAWELDSFSDRTMTAEAGPAPGERSAGRIF